MILISNSQEEESKHLIPEEPKTSPKWWVMFGIGMGVFMFALDVYIVNLALPTMVESLHTSFATIQWVVLSYLLAVAVFVLSASQLGDIFSKKRLYIIGLIVFTISSLLCGLAPTIGFLIASRFFQGLGAAFLSGLGTAIIVEAFPPEQRGLGLGIRAGVFGLGIMSGPTVGGFLIGLGGWPLIFLVNVPIGIIASLIVARVVPNQDVNVAKLRFDIIGTLILTLTLTSFTLGMTLLQSLGFISLGVLAFLVLSILGLVCFLVLESRLYQPMLDLEIFRSLEFSLGLGLRFIGNFVMGGAIFMLPFFFELVKHYSTQQAGLLLAVPPIIIALTAPVAGILSDRFGARIVSLIGLTFMAIGCWSISNFNTELTMLRYTFGIIPYAFGVGMFQSPNNSAIMGAAPQERLGIASGLLSLSRILGQMVGVPLVGTLFSLVTIKKAQLADFIDVTNASPQMLVFGMQSTFRIIAVLLTASVIVAALLWWQSNRKLKISAKVLLN
ncbi:MAG: MFS transporter [Calothrix sp. C42_A2020_038]|nr:MFS transporter [Calothrix sp. C42_A2020_038]